MSVRGQTIALAVVMAAIAPVAANAAVCEVFRRPITLGQDATIEMITESGKDCRIKFNRNEAFDVETSELSARPLYGGARVQPPLGAYYRSNPKFRGRDHFIFTLCGTQGGKNGCSSVYVKVVVH